MSEDPPAMYCGPPSLGSSFFAAHGVPPDNHLGPHAKPVFSPCGLLQWVGETYASSHISSLSGDWVLPLRTKVPSSNG